jgi:hypothetical protein
MMGIRELVKQGKLGDLVGAGQSLQIVMQRIRITGDINNPLKTLQQF